MDGEVVRGRLLARWREAGEWWCGGAQREVAVYLDPAGARRTKVRNLPSLGAMEEAPGDPRPAPPEDLRLDWPLRARKVRDEKVLRACGLLEGKAVPAGWRRPARLCCLHLHSGYAFGRGAMLAEDIPGYAAQGGWAATLLADPFSLAGAAEFDKMARKLGVRPLIGAAFALDTGGELVLVAQSRTGFRSLSRLITECHLDEPRLYPLATWERLERHAEGLLCLTGGSPGPVDLALIRRDHAEAGRLVARLKGIYGADRVFVQIERSYLPWQIQVEARLSELAERHGLVAVAGGPVTHARPGHFPAQDVIACIETLCGIEEVTGRKPGRHPDQPRAPALPARGLNAERYMRSPEEMAALYRDRPGLLENTRLLAERCDPDVLPPRARLPSLYADERAALREIAYDGARRRHGKITGALHRRLERELDRIVGLGFAAHFLIAWDFCEWARAQGCALSGRGSVVDSAVAYCLGLSRIDAFAHRLHFDRFLPADGSKRPDIDIDFEARRRDDVRNYLARKYGPDHVATVAAVGAFCARGIVREVGKVMGLPEEATAYLAKRLHGSVSPDHLEEALDARPELARSGIPRERFRWVFRLARQLMDVPRNMRAHSSGVVISDQPVRDTVPVQQSGAEAVRIIQWDKRSAKRCFDKFDVLCLRGNDVLSDAAERIRAREPGFDADAIPYDQPEVYRAMRSGKLIGIPQSASPAMRQAHVRIRTQDLNDASLVQAGIRPGVGGAVKINELIARRRGKPYGFSHPAFEPILAHTYGIVVFQEQVDQLLQTFVGCSCGEAEEIRESIHKRRREGYAEAIQADLRARVEARGFAPNVAAEAVELICAFQGYGFAQGHALAFAEISLRSVYCQQNHPAEYFAALLNAQPAGYYGPCTLANEARARGVAILPPDVNRSAYEFTVEDVVAEQDPRLTIPGGGVRTGLVQIAGVSEETKRRIVRERGEPPPAGMGSGWGPDFSRASSEPHPGAERRAQGLRPGIGPLGPLGPIGPANGGQGGSAVPGGPSDHRSPVTGHARRGDGGEPRGEGAERRAEGAEPRAEGAEQRAEGAERRAEGAEPRAEGAEPRAEGAEPRAEGAEPRAQGRDGGPDGVRMGSGWGPDLNRASSEPHPGAPGRDAPPLAAAAFGSFAEFVRRARPARDELERLILCGALDGLHPNRRAMLWACGTPWLGAALDPGALPMDLPEPELDPAMADFTEAERALYERAILDLDVRRHLMAFERDRVRAHGGLTAREVEALPHGTRAFLVGNPLRLRFPPTQSGRRVVFFDLEDESGLLNVTMFDEAYRRDGHALVCSPWVTVRGEVQDRDGYPAFLARRVFAYRPLLERLTAGDAPLPVGTADFLAR
jgi:error-prone DNA polymerase